MKTTHAVLNAGLAALLTSAALEAKPISVTLTRTDDSDFPCVVTKADDANLFISRFEDGQAATPMPFTQIKSISWREPEEWTAAMEMWERRDYNGAIPAFAQAMVDYEGISKSKHPLLEDNIGAQAIYFYMECLRRTGKFSDMMDPFVKVQLVNLGPKWQRQIELFRGWAHVAAKRWNPLKLMMEAYEVKEEDIPGINEYTVAPNEPIIVDTLTVHEKAQVAYLRGIATDNLCLDLEAQLAELDPRAESTREQRENLSAEIASMRAQALTDYARAYTVNYGQERGLALRSMLAGLRLMKRYENYDENYALQKEAHGIAVLFNTLSNGKLPTSLQPLLSPPADPEAPE